MRLMPLALSLGLSAAIAIPAGAGSLRRATASIDDSDSWSFIATHVSSAGSDNEVFVNDIPMGPYATEAACVAVMQAYQPVQPPPNVDFVPADGIFRTTCCIDNITGAKDCGSN